eukprot:3434719-Alexandrium_andersonii.AAC.1
MPSRDDCGAQRELAGPRLHGADVLLTKDRRGRSRPVLLPDPPGREHARAVGIPKAYFLILHVRTP